MVLLVGMLMTCNAVSLEDSSTHFREIDLRAVKLREVVQVEEKISNEVATSPRNSHSA